MFSLAVPTFAGTTDVSSVFATSTNGSTAAVCFCLSTVFKGSVVSSSTLKSNTSSACFFSLLSILFGLDGAAGVSKFADVSSVRLFIECGISSASSAFLVQDALGTVFSSVLIGSSPDLEDSVENLRKLSVDDLDRNFFKLLA